MNLAQALGIAAATFVTFFFPMARDYALPSYARAQASIAAETAVFYAETALARAAIQLKSDSIPEPVEFRSLMDREDDEPACAHAETPWL